MKEVGYLGILLGGVGALLAIFESILGNWL